MINPLRMRSRVTVVGLSVTGLTNITLCYNQLSARCTYLQDNVGSTCTAVAASAGGFAPKVLH